MRLAYRLETWAYRRPFVISQWSIEALDVVVVTVEEDGVQGVGECCPALHVGENLADTLARLDTWARTDVVLPNRAHLHDWAPPCPARNGLDCALWDYEAKLSGRSVEELTGVTLPPFVESAYTISLGEPAAMAMHAEEVSDLPVLKLKLGDAGRDLERVKAVRSAAPGARLVVDVNGGWSFEDLRELAPRLADLGVDLIEQPLLRGRDGGIGTWRSPVPLCADESVTDRASLDALEPGYAAINIKLDKTGGLTEALALRRVAEQRGLGVFVGNMGGTSLGMAPAMFVAATADYVDLDGPFLFKSDRDPSLVMGGALLRTSRPDLWG